jgi:hypothetical protein
VSITTASATTDSADCTSLKQSLAALRSGQENYARFVTDLLDDLGTLHARLTQAEQQLALQRQQLSELRSPLPEDKGQTAQGNSAADAELQIRVAELESERQALEEELENIRDRAVNMAEIIAGQKRQMSDEHVQWMSELRQLRRILDKQTKWMTQQNDPSIVALPSAKFGRHTAPLPIEHVASAMLEMHAEDYDALSEGHALLPSPAADVDALQGADADDPILATILTQFEILPKEPSRRPKQK